MKTKEKRIFNLRYFPIIFIGLILGIFLVYNLFSNSWTGFFSYIILFLVAILLCLCLYSKITSRQNKFIEFFSYYFKYYLSLIVSIIVGLILCSISLVGFFEINDYDFSSDSYSGTISSFTENYNYATIELDNFSDYNNDKSLRGSCYLIIENYSNENKLEIGDKIIFSGSVSVNDLYNQIEISNYVEGMTYNAKCDYENVEVISSFSFRNLFKKSVYEKLGNWINNKYVGIVMGVLFGDKCFLDDQTYETFSLSGSAHILAVSGLHIGVLVSVLYFLLSLFKTNEKTKVILVGLILLLYAYVCGFLASICRASIMSIILLISRSTGREYDAISSLSLAGIILLMINPLWLFDVGFQLSFMAVFGIITLSPTFNKLFERIKMPKSLAGVLAITISVNLLVLPVTTSIFKSLSFIALLSNLIVLPLFSIVYVILFITIIMVVILPFLDFILWIDNIFIHFLSLIVQFFADINILNFSIFHVGLLVVVLVSVIAILHKFLMTKNIYKIMISSLMLILVTLSLIINNVPINSNNYVVITSYQYSANTFLINKQSQNYLVGIGCGISDTKNFLEEKNIYNVDFILAYDFSIEKISTLNSLIKKYKIERVYLPKLYENMTQIINSINTTGILFLDEEMGDVGLIKAQLLCNSSCETLAISLKVCEKNIVATNDIDSIAKTNQFCSLIDYEIDYLFQNSNRYNYNDYLANPIRKVYFHNSNKTLSISEKLNKNSQKIEI